MPASRNDWERVGRLLADRRIQISARYANRRAFADDTGTNWRTLYDAEYGKRASFRQETVRAFETAYRLVPGSLGRTLAGGALEPLPAAPAQLRPFPVAPPAAAGSEAQEILDSLLSRYAGDDVIAAIGAQRGKPAWMLVQEILRWLERQGDLAPAQEVLAGLLASHPDTEVIQVIGRQRGKKASMVAAEILDWLSWRPPEMEQGNGTAG